MAWLAKIDHRAAAWPLALRVPYHLAKWTLIALGAYGVIGLFTIELRERRVGLGMGLLVALVFGILNELHNRLTKHSGPTS